MKLIRMPKMPKFKMPRIRKPVPPQKLEARLRAANASASEFYDEEPQTKLTSAFIVVLILHVVAVGGIYAFNQIKAQHRDTAPPAEDTTPAKMAKTTKAPPPAQVAPAKTEKAPAPAATAQTTATPAVKPKPAEPADAKALRSYTVTKGDRLIFIAKKFGTTPEDIVALNKLKDPGKLQIGQVLKIPAKK